MKSKNMKVIKRNGSKEDVSFDKILYRIKKLAYSNEFPPLYNIDCALITQKVIADTYGIDNIHTSQLDEIAATTCVNFSTKHPEYNEIGKRIIISNMHKNTTECFSESMELLYNNYMENSTHFPLINEEIINIVRKNKDQLNFYIDYNRDYLLDYFGYKTLEKSYILKKYNAKSRDYKIIERPQHMWMRVSLGIHKCDINRVLETYDLMSKMYFTHASPTLFNSGTVNHQLSSCFLTTITPDSMEGIYDCLKNCSLISKHAGGIGIDISNIRASGSYIKGTNGKSDGIVKMLKVYDATAQFANQGSRRNGSFACYISPWHADIIEFLELKKNSGSEELRARNLYYALWVSDTFMKAVENDLDWYLMSSDDSPGLSDTYGDEFEKLYYSYVKDNKYRKIIKARFLWNLILVSQIETGMPYMLYKDSINKKCNQKNIGVIRSSNLCAEITLVSNKEEIAVCNICTFSLPKYLEKDNDGKFVYNYSKLYDVVKIATRNMNNVIDYNFYPVPESKISNLRNRPIAMGIQGLADLFFQMKIPFQSNEAKILNKDIMETIQYAGWTASMELAMENGKTYETYEGSPISQGLFQHNLWGVDESTLSGRWDWELLRNKIKKYGVYNSMITALPPTAGTSQILGNYESFEPPNQNIFIRSVLSGDYPIINKYLINHLVSLNLWNENIKNKIILNGGSIQNISEIPSELKEIYKTVWEISQKHLINMSADRAIFVDQTQSLNIHMKNPTFDQLTSMHFHGWKSGLKTGLYYLRTRPASEAQKFTIEDVNSNTDDNNTLVCSIDNKDCLACSG